MTPTSRINRWHFIALLALAADQAAKTAVALNTPLGWTYRLTDFFNLVHVLNPGAAFSFLAGAGGWQRWFFLAIAIVVSSWLIWMLTKPRETSESLSFSLILGGALGNAFDRAARGQVVDYLDFHLGGWHWPAFNLADVAITAGAILMVLASFRSNSDGASKPVRT